MKVGIATTLSIAGVLAAGAAAFAVNTSVLSASPSASTNAVVAAGLTPDQTNVAVDTPLVRQASVSSTPVTNQVTAYQVGTSGSVVIDTSSGAIVVTNVIPSAGWTSEPARTDENGDVKVHFNSGTNRIEFIARMTNGSVKVDVKVEQSPSALVPLSPVPGVTPPAEQTKSAYSDDDRKEDHEDDDEDRDSEEHDQDEDDD